MANISEPNAAYLKEWEEWLAVRPPDIAALARRFPPWKLFHLPNPLGGKGCRVTVVGFDEHADRSPTIKVYVSGQFNLVAFERVVFGIEPEQLTECDLPGPDEPLGVLLNDQQAEAWLSSHRGDCTDPRCALHGKKQSPSTIH